MKAKEVFVVVITYNGMQWIEDCLNSVERSSIQASTVVIDNASTDNTVSFISKNFPSVNILNNSENLGFGKANNLGMSYAIKNGADYVFLLNQDAYLQNDTLEILVRKHQENNEFGLLSPIHLNGDGTRLDRNFSNYITYDDNKEFYSDHVLNNVNEIPYEVPFVNAAAWLLPKATLEKIGGFDPIFFHYGEDDNYCQKLVYEGLKIGVVANCYVRHDREDVVKRRINSFEDELKKLETKYKVKYANVNSRIKSVSKLSYLKKALYFLVFKGYSEYVKQKKKELVRRNAESESIKSRDNFFRRNPYMHL